MTVKTITTITVVCDICNAETNSNFNPEFDTYEHELEWFDVLRKEGWVHDEENDEHYCPACSES